MGPIRLKTCPDCGAHAAIDALSCGACGHGFRTQFASRTVVAAPNPQRMPPTPHPSAGAGTSPPLDWSDSYAQGRRRMKWVWAIGGTIVGLKALSLVVPLLLVLIAPHWASHAYVPHVEEELHARE